LFHCSSFYFCKGKNFISHTQVYYHAPVLPIIVVKSISRTYSPSDTSQPDRRTVNLQTTKDEEAD
ncbi:hypothetical protein, partial [Bacteroides sp.]|uniref:hypothetical protein n=1 Tax=Bacteroides sp. TaxID=29523 RepID=UPI0023C0357B